MARLNTIMAWLNFWNEEEMTMAAYVTISSNAVSDVPISFPYSFTTIHLLSTSFPITFTRLCLYFGCLMFSLFSPDTSSSGSVACSAVFLLRVLYTSVGKTTISIIQLFTGSPLTRAGSCLLLLRSNVYNAWWNNKIVVEGVDSHKLLFMESFCQVAW